MSQSLIFLALSGTLAVSTASAQPVSQVASAPRLTVRPQRMATGTRTTHAGLTEVDGFPNYAVYVPKQCVGTRRVPLIVLLHGGGRSASLEIGKLRPLADKYGVIVLLPNATDPGQWDLIYGGRPTATAMETATGMKLSEFPMHDVQNIDSAMTLILRTHAIDPNRIALLGFSDGGSVSLLLGRSNLDIFNRVVALSALIPFDGVGPAHPATQFLLSGGMAEGMVRQTLKLAQVLRQEGHPVATLLGLRGHVDYVVDEEFVWGWLLKSWQDPHITTRVAAPVDSDPVLTMAALTKLTAFWDQFQWAADSILQTGRMAHQEEISLALGQERVSVITMDMPAMAATYPAVAVMLQAAGLTAREEEADRRALIRVEFTRQTGMAPGEALDSMRLGQQIPFVPIAPTSVLGQNLAFRQAHEAEFAALAKTEMWTTQ